MVVINTNEYNHQWEKQNNITQWEGSKKRKRPFDLLKCSRCGIEGKAYSLSTITLKSTFGKKIYECDGKSLLPKRIKITHCNAHGQQFVNLTPNSEHDVVEPAEGYKNDPHGVWVMGVGEKVKVLQGEFTIIS